MAALLLDSPHQAQELLKPLSKQEMTADYRNQYIAFIEFSNRLQSLTRQFEDLYSKISKLEEEIAAHKTMHLS